MHRSRDRTLSTHPVPKRKHFLKAYNEKALSVMPTVHFLRLVIFIALRRYGPNLQISSLHMLATAGVKWNHLWTRVGLRDYLSATYNLVLSSLPLQICPNSHSDSGAHHLEATPAAIHEHCDVAVCDAVQCQGISTISSQQMKPLGWVSKPTFFPKQISHNFCILTN